MSKSSTICPKSFHPIPIWLINSWSILPPFLPYGPWFCVSWLAAGLEQGFLGKILIIGEVDDEVVAFDGLPEQGRGC